MLRACTWVPHFVILLRQLLGDFRSPAVVNYASPKPIYFDHRLFTSAGFSCFTLAARLKRILACSVVNLAIFHYCYMRIHGGL